MARNEKNIKNNKITLKASFSRNSSLIAYQIYVYLPNSQLKGDRQLAGGYFASKIWNKICSSEASF